MGKENYEKNDVRKNMGGASCARRRRRGADPLYRHAPRP